MKRTALVLSAFVLVLALCLASCSAVGKDERKDRSEKGVSVSVSAGRNDDIYGDPDTSANVPAVSGSETPISEDPAESDTETIISVGTDGSCDPSQTSQNSVGGWTNFH